MPDRYRMLAPYYDIFIDWERRLRTEMPFLLEASGVRWKNEARVLDIGCGTGRHLAGFVQAGCRVEGLEPSVQLRRIAERTLPGAPIHSWGMGGLGRLAQKRGPWDLVLCLGNTLAHLPPSRLDSFCRNLLVATGPGGKAVLHLLNYSRILRLRPEQMPAKTRELEGAQWSFLRSYAYRESSLDFKLEVYRDGAKVAVDVEKHYPLDGERLRQALRSAGFRSLRFLGAFDNNIPFTPDSGDLVALVSSGAAEAKMDSE
ncbi:class I SAM-dependent methyltransferase [bacterium]|nr:class I SAM-dependent methyltransferase [bacterium]